MEIHRPYLTFVLFYNVRKNYAGLTLIIHEKRLVDGRNPAAGLRRTIYMGSETAQSIDAPTPLRTTKYYNELIWRKRS